MALKDTAYVLSLCKGADLNFYELYKQKKSSNLQESMEYLRLFLSSADTSVVNSILADLCVELSEYYRDNFQFDDALSFRSRSYNINCNLSRKSAIAEDEYSLAELYYMSGEYDLAFKFATVSKEHFEIEEDTLHLLECYNILGALYHIAGEIALSESYLQQYLSGARRYGDDKILVRALNNVTLSYLGDTAKSKMMIREALELCLASGDSSQLCKIYLNMATSHLASNQPDAANSVLNKVSGLMERLDDFGHYYFIKGMVAYQANKIDSALVYTNMALDYFTQGKFEVQQRNCINIIQEIYARKGDYENAYLYLKKMFSGSTNMKLVLNSQDSDLYKNLIKAQNDIYLKSEKAVLDKKYYVKVLVFIICVLVAVAVILYVVNILRHRKLRIVEKEMDFVNLQMSNERKEQEIQTQKEVLEVKTMQQYQFSRTRDDIVDRLSQLIYRLKDRESKQVVNQICSELKGLGNDMMWDEINHCVKGVNSTFYKNLLKEFPDLTVNERRLCGLLNMNLTSKEIAEITHQSPQTINTARARLRHRLGITGEDYSIQEFLSKFN